MGSLCTDVRKGILCQSDLALGSTLESSVILCLSTVAGKLREVTAAQKL